MALHAALRLIHAKTDQYSAQSTKNLAEDPIYPIPTMRHADALGQTLTEQLAARFASRIRDHLLPAGTRLPSVRQCAQQQGVSPSTVVAAYDHLQAQGLIEVRPQRGFFVREVQAGRAPRRPIRWRR